MTFRTRKTKLIITASVLIVALVCSVSLLTYRAIAPKPVTDQKAEVSQPLTEQQTPVEPAELYKGQTTPIASSFSIKVPNGWSASISNDPNFLAVMFARPNQLDSLVYTPDATPTIDQQGIPSWSGLTEHFFVIEPLASRQFNPTDHQEVSSEPFTFDDGTVGQRYYVVKHAAEAQQYGGLQKDSEWIGRTYIYEKDGKHVEAHLALYPSSGVDVAFLEGVIKTLTVDAERNNS